MNIETRLRIYSTATCCGWLAAAFLVVFSVQMLFLYSQRLPSIPSDDAAYSSARQDLLHDAKNEGKQAAFQEDDLRMRELFFAQRTGFAWGTWLLLGGLLTMTACFATASVVKPPQPQVSEGGRPLTDTDSLRATRVGYALASVGVITLATILFTCVPRPGLSVLHTAARDEVSSTGETPTGETPTGETQSEPMPTDISATPPAVPGEDENPFLMSDDTPDSTPDSTPGGTTDHTPDSTPGGTLDNTTDGVPAAGQGEDEIESPPTSGDEPQATVSPILLSAELAKVSAAGESQWPRFRGPWADGVSAYANVPRQWNDATGENILWKVPVPLEGFSSPVVWEKHVFLTGGTEQAREIYCFDADTGDLRWQHSVSATDAGAKAASNPDYKVDYTGYAPSTGVTDGLRFYAIFTNGDLVAVDFDGSEVWKRGLGVPKNVYGHASSLVLFDNLLLVQYDQGGKSANLSKIMAINTETGENVWETARPGIPNSWPTPILVPLEAEHEGKTISQTQLITGADPFLMAYDVHTGRELWKVKCLQADVGPSPIFVRLADSHQVQIVVASEFPQATGVSPPVVLENTEAVDITKTHIVWKNDLGLPDTVSPVTVAGKYLILFDKSGTVTCLSLSDGEMLWDDYQWMGELMLSPTASPGVVGEEVYLVTDAQMTRDETFSKCYVISISDTGMKIEHEGTLSEGCVTSPAFADGRIYLRGQQHLYALGEKQGEGEVAKAAETPEDAPIPEVETKVEEAGASQQPEQKEE